MGHSRATLRHSREGGNPLRLASLVIGICLAAHPASAQVLTGFPPFASETPSTFDTIDNGNLNVHFAIPIFSRAGKAGFNFSYVLSYDSAIWQPYSYWCPDQTNWGWRGITGPLMGYAIGNHTTGGCYNSKGKYSYDIYGPWTYYDAQGTMHYFPITVSDGQSTPCSGVQPYSQTLTTTDGSGWTMTATAAPSATLVSRSGITIVPPLNNDDPTSGTASITDTNSNVIYGNFSASTSTFYDSLNTGSSAALTVDTSQAPSTVKYTYTGPSDTAVSFTVTYTQKYVQTSFGCSGVSEYGPTQNWLMTGIALPDTSSYSFTYETTPNDTHNPHYVTGRIAGVTLPMGGTISYAYSGPYNGINCADGSTATLTRTLNPGSAQWTYTHTPQTGSEWTTDVTDGAGNQINYTFQGIYETLRQVYQGGSTQLETINTCYNGNTSSCTTTAVSLPISEISPTKVLGSLESQTNTDYNSYGLPTEYDEYAFGSGAVGALVRKTLTTYNTALNGIHVYDRPSTIEVNDSSGTTRAETAYSYDGYGNETQETRYTGGTPSTVSRTFTPGTNGVLTAVTDFNGNSTTYSSFACNSAFPATTTLPLSLSTSTSWNCYVALPNSASDVNGESTSFGYDSMIRPTTTGFPDGGGTTIDYTSTTVYDVLTNVFGSTQRHDQIDFDGLGRVTTNALVNDPDGETYVVTGYDPDGRVLTVSNPYRGSTSQGGDTYAYDALNRINSVTHADSSVAYVYYGTAVSSAGGRSAQICAAGTYGYGYPTLMTDETGKLRQTWTDGLGRTIEVDEPDPATGSLTSGNVNGTCYTYDALSNLYQVIQGSETRTFSHDMLSRLTQTSTPEAGTTHLCYTSSSSACATPDTGTTLCSGNPKAVCRRTDARGITTTYTYDALNRVTGKSYSNNNPTATAYTYDQTSCLGLSVSCYNKGRRTTMTDASGSTQWAYDSMGRILIEHRTIGSVTNNIEYTYNLDGSAKTVTYPSGRTITYTVSAAERPLSAVDTSNNINYTLNATYAPQGSVAGALFGESGSFGGITYAATYNKRLLPYTVSATSSAANALNLTFTYFSNGNVETIANNLNSGRTESPTYDDLNRISTAKSTATSGTYCWGQSFGYDRYANLKTATTTQCTLPMLNLSVNTNNQITNSGFAYDASGNLTSDGTYSYVWDARPLLQSAGGVTYTYDGDGKRAMKSSGTLYWNSTGGTPLAETNSSGATVNEYIFFGGERVARRDSSGNVYYYFQDQLGTTKTLTNSSGVVCYDADFTPFGIEMPYVATCPQNYKFTGLERDSETSLDHALYRKYDSTLGRWLTTDNHRGDPLNPQSWNRYAYVLNNPCSFTDLLGLDPCSFNIAVVIMRNTGLTGSQVAALQNEMAWVLGQAGVGVSFVQPDSADYTVTVSPYNPPALSSSVLGFTPFDPSSPVTPVAARHVENYGFVLASHVAQAPFAFTPSTFGSALGAVAAHEFGHWALPLPTDSDSFTGIMGPATGSFSLNPIPLRFTALQAQRLQGHCQELHGNNGGAGGPGGGPPDPSEAELGDDDWSSSNGSSPNGGSGGSQWTITGYEPCPNDNATGCIC